MSDGKRIAELVRQVHRGEPHHGEGEAWHGPALKTLLEGITAEQAARKLALGAHSIWELVLHIAGWQEVIVQRLAGQKVEHPINSPSDWPKVGEPNEPAWRAALEKLDTSTKRLMDAASGASDELLEQKAVNREFTNYVMLHGIVHHTVYHSGQIASLRKMLAER